MLEGPGLAASHRFLIGRIMTSLAGQDPNQPSELSSLRWENRLRHLFGPFFQGEMFDLRYAGQAIPVIHGGRFGYMAWSLITRQGRPAACLILFVPRPADPVRQAQRLLLKYWSHPTIRPAFLSLPAAPGETASTSLAHPDFHPSEAHPLLTHLIAQIRISPPTRQPDHLGRWRFPVEHLANIARRDGWRGRLFPLDPQTRMVAVLAERNRSWWWWSGAVAVGLALPLGWVLIWPRRRQRPAWRAGIHATLLGWFIGLATIPLVMVAGNGFQRLDHTFRSLREERLQELEAQLDFMDGLGSRLTRFQEKKAARILARLDLGGPLHEVQYARRSFTPIESRIRQAFRQAGLALKALVVFGHHDFTIAAWDLPIRESQRNLILDQFGERLKGRLPKADAPPEKPPPQTRTTRPGGGSLGLTTPMGNLKGIKARQANFMAIGTQQLVAFYDIVRYRGQSRFLVVVVWDQKKELHHLLASRAIRPRLPSTTLLLGSCQFADHRLIWSSHPNPWVGRLGRLGRGSPVVQEFMMAGQPMLGASRPAHHLPGYTLVAAAPLTDIHARLDRHRTWFLALLAMMLLYLVGIAWELADHLADPLHRMTRALCRISAGDLDATIHEGRNDELGFATQALDRMTETLRERRRLTRFVPPQVLEAVAGGDLRRLTDGCAEHVTVLASDIRGFTTLCETHPPEAIFALLNAHLKRMVAIIQHHGGIVDRFIGDAIVAVFPTTAAAGAGAERATAAAQEMMAAQAGLVQERLAQGAFPYAIGIGLATGRVVSGIVGAEDVRLDYTVLGETVTRAGALESLSRHGRHTRIIVDEATRAAWRTARAVCPVEGTTGAWELEEILLSGSSATGAGLAPDLAVRPDERPTARWPAADHGPPGPRPGSARPRATWWRLALFCLPVIWLGGEWKANLDLGQRQQAAQALQRLKDAWTDLEHRLTPGAQLALDLRQAVERAQAGPSSTPFAARLAEHLSPLQKGFPELGWQWVEFTAPPEVVLRLGRPRARSHPGQPFAPIGPEQVQILGGRDQPPPHALHATNDDSFRLELKGDHEGRPVSETVRLLAPLPEGGALRLPFLAPIEERPAPRFGLWVGVDGPSPDICLTLAIDFPSQELWVETSARGPSGPAWRRVFLGRILEWPVVLGVARLTHGLTLEVLDAQNQAITGLSLPAASLLGSSAQPSARRGWTAGAWLDPGPPEVLVTPAQARKAAQGGPDLPLPAPLVTSLLGMVKSQLGNHLTGVVIQSPALATWLQNDFPRWQSQYSRFVYLATDLLRGFTPLKVGTGTIALHLIPVFAQDQSAPPSQSDQAIEAVLAATVRHPRALGDRYQLLHSFHQGFQGWIVAWYADHPALARRFVERAAAAIATGGLEIAIKPPPGSPEPSWWASPGFKNVAGFHPHRVQPGFGPIRGNDWIVWERTWDRHGFILAVPWPPAAVLSGEALAGLGFLVAWLTGGLWWFLGGSVPRGRFLRVQLGGTFLAALLPMLAICWQILQYDVREGVLRIPREWREEALRLAREIDRSLDLDLAWTHRILADSFPPVIDAVSATDAASLAEPIPTAWRSWARDLASRGILVQSGLVMATNGRVVSYPSTEGKENLTGYRRLLAYLGSSILAGLSGIPPESWRPLRLNERDHLLVGSQVEELLDLAGLVFGPEHFLQSFASPHRIGHWMASGRRSEFGVWGFHFAGGIPRGLYLATWVTRDREPIVLSMWAPHGRIQHQGWTLPVLFAADGEPYCSLVAPYRKVGTFTELLPAESPRNLHRLPPFLAGMALAAAQRQSPAWQDEGAGEGRTLHLAAPLARLGNLAVLMEVPLGRMLQAWERYRMVQLGTFLGLIFFVLLLARHVARHVLQPVSELTLAIRRVMDGDFQVAISECYPGEFGELARAFNHMTKEGREGRLLGRFVSAGVRKVARDQQSAAIARSGERREAIVLFASLAGFKEVLARRPPEAVIHDLNRFLEEASRAILAHHGEIDKFIGEKILALFPPDAVEAALTAARNLWQVARRHRDRLPCPLAMGMTNGPVLAGIMGADDIRLEYTVLGDTVNLAARLCDLAASRPGGGLVCDDRLHEAASRTAASHQWRFTPLEETSVKGKSQILRLFLAIPEEG
ncbi:MAG: Adenylate cyclase [Candidatus Ozemobacter sibiricus]|uniref:Adenylate cyclase n=1 Tax=Candidatus Ozemobacter sibiricus TaxID=2268124 RepID=A0A367ZD25_9BACT|nr:MAG: Adenylate cyclase [Candidatus Ozemobacter sibiricus]